MATSLSRQDAPIVTTTTELTELAAAVQTIVGELHGVADVLAETMGVMLDRLERVSAAEDPVPRHLSGLAEPSPVGPVDPVVWERVGGDVVFNKTHTVAQGHGPDRGIVALDAAGIWEISVAYTDTVTFHIVADTGCWRYTAKSFAFAARESEHADATLTVRLDDRNSQWYYKIGSGPELPMHRESPDLDDEHCAVTTRVRITAYLYDPASVNIRYVRRSPLRCHIRV